MPTKIVLRTVSPNRAPARGIMFLQYTFQGATKTIPTVLVPAETPQFIVGMTFCRAFDITLAVCPGWYLKHDSKLSENAAADSPQQIQCTVIEDRKSCGRSINEIFAATHSIVVGISLDPNYESDTSFAVDADLIMTASASVENTGVSSPLMSERIVPSWFDLLTVVPPTQADPQLCTDGSVISDPAASRWAEALLCNIEVDVAVTEVSEPKFQLWPDDPMSDREMVERFQDIPTILKQHENFKDRPEIHCAFINRADEILTQMYRDNPLGRPSIKYIDPAPILSHFWNQTQCKFSVDMSVPVPTEELPMAELMAITLDVRPRTKRIIKPGRSRRQRLREEKHQRSEAEPEIASTEAVKTASGIDDTVNDVLPEKRENVTMPHELTAEQQERLDQVLAMFPYTPTSGPLNKTSSYVQHIRLIPEAKPEMRKQYPLPHYVLEEVREEVKKLVERDIIEPIEWSPWRWPILWVRKKTGGGRICLDARGLNNLTIPDAFPSINVDHILRRLKRSKWISGHV